MKSFQVLNAQPVLSKLAEMDIPLKASVLLAKPFKDALDLHRSIIEKRAELFKTYGALDELKDQWTVPPENKDKFTEEYTRLMETELKWEYPPVDITVFGNDVNLSIAEAAKIDWFLQAA